MELKDLGRHVDEEGRTHDYLVTEHVDGQSVAELLAKKREVAVSPELWLSFVARVGLVICRVLTVARQLRSESVWPNLARRVSTETILISEDGSIKLALLPTDAEILAGRVRPGPVDNGHDSRWVSEVLWELLPSQVDSASRERPAEAGPAGVDRPPDLAVALLQAMKSRGSASVDPLAELSRALEGFVESEADSWANAEEPVVEVVRKLFASDMTDKTFVHASMVSATQDSSWANVACRGGEGGRPRFDFGEEQHLFSESGYADWEDTSSGDGEDPTRKVDLKLQQRLLSVSGDSPLHHAVTRPGAPALSTESLQLPVTRRLPLPPNFVDLPRAPLVPAEEKLQAGPDIAVAPQQLGVWARRAGRSATDSLAPVACAVLFQGQNNTPLAWHRRLTRALGPRGALYGSALSAALIGGLFLLGLGVWSSPDPAADSLPETPNAQLVSQLVAAPSSFPQPGQPPETSSGVGSPEQGAGSPRPVVAPRERVSLGALLKGVVLPVSFATGRSRMVVTDQDALTEILEVAERNDQYIVRVTGYAASGESGRSAARLGRERAQEVADHIGRQSSGRRLTLSVRGAAFRTGRDRVHGRFVVLQLRRRRR